MKLELFPEVKLLVRGRAAQAVLWHPLTVEVAEQTVKEIGASRACTGSGLGSGWQDLPVGCGRCHPCWVRTTEMSSLQGLMPQPHPTPRLRDSPAGSGLHMGCKTAPTLG